MKELRKKEKEFKSKVYIYTQRASNSPWPIWSGALHADEIAFVFGQVFVFVCDQVFVFGYIFVIGYFYVFVFGPTLYLN